MQNLLCILSILLATAVVSAQEPAPRYTPNPSGFAIHRGTNLSHWLSQDFGWAPRDTWITEKDIQFIAGQGFDHVRLPVDEKELWLEDGSSNKPEMARMVRAIEWCRGAGLRVIVDLHVLKSHHFNAANEGGRNTLWTDPAAQEHLLSLWRELSASLRRFPVDSVAYEILNEPVADDPEDWNKLLARCYTTLRGLEPKRVIVVGANRWQMPQNLPLLKAPEGDKNLILSFHTYVPLLFTHYKADWVPIKTYTGPVRYPGPIVDKATFAELTRTYDAGLLDQIGNAAEAWNADRLRKEFEPAIRTTRKHGLQLYCGEFGCLPTVPRADRLAYYRDIISVFEAEDVAYANWEYKGDFGIYEWLGLPKLCGAPDSELIRILVPKKSAANSQ
ncbi:MAG: cellulase family glycosylhydrolase [Vicinamibacteria bacterium]|nr:cellulase family glycosylhydrolase [Vicinamibacteria bacterium]